MDRRTVIRNAGALATLSALAGCSVSETSNTPTQGGSSGGGDGGATSAESSGDSGGSDGSAESGGSTETATPATITAWYKLEGAEVEFMNSQIQAFNAESPHTVEGANISELSNKTTTQIPAGTGPHTFEWAHDWVGDYYQRGFLSDQSGNVDVNVEEKFTETAVNAAKFDGALVGLPISAETVGLVYNKDMVDAPPETLSEMQSMMEEHHDPDNGSYGLSYPINPYFISAWAHAFGGYYYDEENDELGLTNEETLQGFQLILDQLLPFMPADTGYDPQASVFQNGNAPFAINGPWFFGNVADMNVDVAPLPSPDGGSPTPYTGVALWYFTKRLDNGGPEAEAARSWAEWFATNEETILSRSQEFSDVPVLKSLQGSDELPGSVQGYSQAIAQGTPIPTRPHMNSVWGPVGDAFTRAMNGNQDLEPSMAQAEETIRSAWSSS